MPAPTTKPKPSPKSPPICKKPPAKTSLAALPPARRVLTAQVGAWIAQTGLPAAIVATVTLYPLATPGQWEGNTFAGGFEIEVTLTKNTGDDNYLIQLDFLEAASSFYSKSWSDTPPRQEDPLEFADVQYKDPSTGDDATLTIMS